ncbi:uracil-DNA glycosylase [Methylobacterium sp. J-048]|uniref:uracil-DNA glycosylase n=1 Tax=Methylobacterium sp. J-048 TaxID=2836635 RepID=UPI001FBB645F|nr:uracil-DNA glycosylase [Methylobacterium sp. J-048]MCJ2059282.1 uracil-DNA glycosylase [Methylobacterium sp. J-048]
MPLEPRAPKSLADPGALAARRALIAAPHIAPIRALAERISAERGAPVPVPDPLDGGVAARMLLLLETPGPAVLRTGFVTRDSANGTAANLFRFLQESGIPRGDTLIWNVVPWLIHAEGALNRAPRRAEIIAAAPYLAPLLDLLPRLTVAVLAGRYANGAAPAIAALRPGLPLIAIPHPSPTYVCTAPEVPARIRRGLSEAAAILRRG